ncbi:MAG: inorganic phosphate transporter [Deltaproteobacteria bacterium]|nr:inorganic phosphate transporter [Deltaproteobacteria bacterium]MBW2415130.1 inorganic phosphate transporter [Deltaproteobacteria bacterium]
MAYAIGANDVANAMGTSVGSRSMTLVQAVIVAAIFEFLGAWLVGGHVTRTIRGGILDPVVTAASLETLKLGMLAALTSAGTWLIIASRLGWPVSTTHSIVGAIAGFGIVAFGPEAVEGAKLLRIVSSWLISPLISGTIAFLIIVQIRRSILNHEDPIARMRRWAPAYGFAVVLAIGLITLLKGLKNLHLDFSLPAAIALSCGLGLVGAALTRFFVNRIRVDPEAERDFHFATVERMFGRLQILSACAIAFAHGSNDVANAIAPVAAILSAESGVLEATAPVPPWLLLLGGAGIVVGLSTLGYRVMATIGERITELTPSRGYAATFAAAITIGVASRMGLPISTTHTLVGAVLGVGLARGIGALDYRVVGTIAVSWIVTIPVGGALAVFFYYFYKGLLT